MQALNLLTQEQVGDHIMFVGEIIEITADENIKPLAYYNGMLEVRW